MRAAGATIQATDEWEKRLRAWSKPPTTTEEQRCDNAVSVVRNAIDRSDALQDRDVRIFAQGSYRNGTNVRADSDVDICVCCHDVFFFQLPPDAGPVGVPASYTFQRFRGDVIDAVADYLGADAISVGNKCIDLHENTYRVDADVVPTFEHRRYYFDSRGQLTYHAGTELRPPSGGIVNWPEQNYRNGTDKNLSTSMRFKKLVRILKRLRNDMEVAGISAATAVPSYLLECLVWNAPNHVFGHTSYVDDLREVLRYLYDQTKSDQSCQSWAEVNELKYLFHSTQGWTRPAANTFIVEAWRYVGVL